MNTAAFTTPGQLVRGLLLMAHGARDPAWAAPFEAVAAAVRASDADLHVAIGYLEFMSPTIQQAGRELAAAGCERVDLVPLFLGAGGHVRKDVPLVVQALAAAFPAITWSLRPAIGEVDSVVAAMAAAALQTTLEPTTPATHSSPTSPPP
jgi:sirohydrochlorin cobaltochelatase